MLIQPSQMGWEGSIKLQSPILFTKTSYVVFLILCYLEPSLHWRSLFVNVSDSDILCTCLGYLGQHYTDRISAICVPWTKVYKTST